MTDREIMQQALEALNHVNVQDRVQIITALRERLAQPEQEPVAWLHRDSWGTLKLSQTMPPPVGAFPVYTAPQQEPVIDKAAAIRIATVLGWEPPREEQEPVVKWDASAPLVVTPHPAFQATQQRREWAKMKEDSMTFDNWWATLTHKEQQMIGINNAKFVWQQACEACAQIADKAEPYKAAELIRAAGHGHDPMPLFSDWPGGFK